MLVRVRMCPGDEDVVLRRSSGQVQNFVGEAEQQGSFTQLHPVEGSSGTSCSSSSSE